MTWLDMECEAKKGLRRLKEYKEIRKNYKGLNEEVNNEIASEIVNCSEFYIKEIKKKVLFDYNSISIDDIHNPLFGLTDRQKEILLLRQSGLKYEEIATSLEVGIAAVFRNYKAAVNRILKIKNDNLSIFTKKQKIIYNLWVEGWKYKQIAEKLNISLSSVKTHMGIIKKKSKLIVNIE
ncbi:hypothetical protein JYT99_01845 [bacterium AH-315-E09]|nr:hypothetical protein [Alkaliphilus sp. AH-315-G20]MBN4074653.1 hypothetical protein [bacterium AH-315-E09]